MIKNTNACQLPFPSSQLKPVSRLLVRAACVLAFCFAPLLVSAQQAPLITPRDLRPETSVKPPMNLPQPASAAIPSNAAVLFVRLGDVAVKGGFPEFAAGTEALLSPLRAQRVSVERLYKLAESIEMLYREAGFALVRVLLPPQSLNDGDTLQLIVLDGFIERVDASAIDKRSRSYVLAVMQTVVGQRRLSSDALERVLTLAGRGAGLAMRSTMGAGVEPGGVVLTLDGTFTPGSVTISADNRLSKSLGPWETTLQVSLNEPFGEGVQIYSYVSGGKDWQTAFGSDARRRVLGGGATIPIGASGLSINPEFTWSDSQPLPQPGAPLSQSKFERYTLRFIYPLILNRREELTITGTLDASRQMDTLPQFQSVAADGSILGPFILDQDRLRVARMGAIWNQTLANSGSISVGATVSTGVSGLGARTKKDVTDSGIAMSRVDANPVFVKFEGNVSYEQQLPLRVESKLLLRVQKALNGALPASELFSLDGEDGLSTFTTGSISDDGGWLLRQEFTHSMTWEAGTVVNFVPYVFGAAGKTSNQLASPAVRGINKAYGFGLRMQWQNINFSMEYGRRESALSALNDNQLFAKGQVQF